MNSSLDRNDLLSLIRMSILQAVTHAEGEALAKSYGIPFYETSAKRGTGVRRWHSLVLHTSWQSG